VLKKEEFFTFFVLAIAIFGIRFIWSRGALFLL